MTNPRILFVDDEPNLLAGLRRLLRGQRSVWDMDFAEGPQAALDRLAQSDYDIVVSDMRMPGMDGAQLLSVICREYPQTSRIILSGHANRASIISAVGPTQQYLSKPCDSNVLIETLNRVTATRAVIGNPALRELLGGVTSLPKPPRIYREMIALASQENCPLADVVAVIESDLATSAEALHLVNSAFFALPGRVDTIERAVTLLGLETIQALAVAGAVFRSDDSVPGGLNLTELTARGLKVGSLARLYATREGWPAERVGDVFFAGLLHEVALPLLATRRPDDWQALRGLSFTDPRAAAEAEAEHLGCPVSHASAYILGMWGFSQPIVETLVQLHLPEEGQELSPEAEIVDQARRKVAYPQAEQTHTNFRTPERLARWAEVEGDVLNG